MTEAEFIRVLLQVIFIILAAPRTAHRNATVSTSMLTSITSSVEHLWSALNNGHLNHLDRLPQEVVESPSLEIFKSCCLGQPAAGGPVCGCGEGKDWTRPPEVPSNLSHSAIL